MTESKRVRPDLPPGACGQCGTEYDMEACYGLKGEGTCSIDHKPHVVISKPCGHGWPFGKDLRTIRKACS